jgi:uncharacterized protein YlxW (UPF0749 family)
MTRESEENYLRWLPRIFYIAVFIVVLLLATLATAVTTARLTAQAKTSEQKRLDMLERSDEAHQAFEDEQRRRNIAQNYLNAIEQVHGTSQEQQAQLDEARKNYMAEMSRYFARIKTNPGDTMNR